MQDIVFYAVASETLGSVRDYANARKRPAPILTLGVSVCLRMRLFAAQNDATPYPIDSFSGIVDWQWRMDDDLDRNTTCKLVADADSISVHTANGVFDGSNLHFTEFVIPISNMNTQELATWIGNGKKRSGLTGELVGYDNAGNAVFVLQIENFTIRNRVGGLGDPTAMDQEVVTRTQAESLIQAVVSASADTKQDKLNFSNAGTGISISSNGVISTDDVPQSVVTGLSASLAAKQNNISAGDLMEISGTTVNRKRYMNIIADSSIITRTITPEGSQTSVSAYVLEPGNAYKINVTSSAKWLATTAAFKGSTGTWGIEGHIELFVAGTGYVRTDSNVILADALEPDAVNNCTVRFHDGLAIISVEDHVAGYIVTVNASSGMGSLPYALATVSQEYVAFDASLNGQTLDLAGATTYAGERHVVGNGYSETILSGGIACTSKTTFSNLSMDGVSVNGGTMTMGDVNIPNGATVSVSGGGLAVEKVTGNGGVIDLGGTNVVIPTGGTAYASGCTFTGGQGNRCGVCSITSQTINMTNCVFSGNLTTSYGGGAMYLSGQADFTSCVFSGNSAAAYGAGAIYAYKDSTSTFLTFSKCVISGNLPSTLNDIYVSKGSAILTDCTIGYYATNGAVTLAGSNSFDKLIGTSGSVTISSGAIVDLTGNTNTTPINPGGGITFAEGGATVYPSAGSASAYMLGGMTVPQIGNTNVVNLSNSNAVVPVDVSGYASNVVLSGGSASDGGGVCVSSGASIEMRDCVFSGCKTDATGRGGALFTRGDAVSFMNCTFSSNTANAGGAIYVFAGTMTANGCTFKGNSTVGGTLYVRENASAVFSGENTFSASQDILTGTNAVVALGGTVHNLALIRGNGSAVISSGAIIDITGNAGSDGKVIYPTGGITVLGGGAYVGSAVLQIPYSSGTYSGTRVFQDVEIHGTSITQLGAIYGATVTFPDPNNGYYVRYTTDGGQTSSVVEVGTTGEYDVEEQLGAGVGLVGVDVS